MTGALLNPPTYTALFVQVSERATGVYEARVAVLRSGTYQVHLNAQAGGLPDDGGPGDDVAAPLPLTVGAAEYVTASSKVRFRSLRPAIPSETAHTSV